MNDPTARLHELEQRRDDAREAEHDARDEHARRQRAVAEARAAVTAAYASGGEVKAAEAAYTTAQKAASDPMLAARLEGLGRAARVADAAVRSHIEANVSALIEEVRPRAEAAVAAIKQRAADLRDALAEYSAVGSEIGRRSAYVQWFELHRQMPAAPVVDKLSSQLDPCRLDTIPVPMPRSTEHPVAEQERLQREHEASVEAARAARAARTVRSAA